MVEKVPKPNSSMLVFPMSLPPAALIFAMDVASNAGLYPIRILEPEHVSISMDVRLSFAENRKLAPSADVSSVMAWNMEYFPLISFSLDRTVSALMKASAPLHIPRRCSFP